MYNAFTASSLSRPLMSAFEKQLFWFVIFSGQLPDSTGLLWSPPLTVCVGNVVPVV